MAIYRIAGVYVEMTPRYERLRSYSEKYLFEGDPPNEVLKVELSDEYLKKRMADAPYLSPEDIEYIWLGACFAHKMLEYRGFVLHSSAVAYENKAYLFSADSGTGKSTHTGFWRQCFGEENTAIINDDKPLIREIDGVFYAAGTPFSGKSSLSENVTVPIKALCFIHRSERDEIRRMTTGEALEKMFDQMLRPGGEESALMLLELLDGFLTKVPVFSLWVTFSPYSARFAYAELNKQ